MHRKFSAYSALLYRPRAPHPAAASVYLDWFLSREGQAAWNKGGAINSRRLDVEPADPATMPKPGVDYLYIEREQNLHLRAADLGIGGRMSRTHSSFPCVAH